MKHNLFNRWQMAAYLSNAAHKVIVGGRGCGKTFELGIDTHKMARVMPRGLFFVCADTYDRIKNSTAPAMLAAWGYLGWNEYNSVTGKGDYVFNKQPPAHWPRPYFALQTAENTIFTKTGAAFKFVSQAARNARGFSFDGGVIDEGLTLNRSFVDNDLLPSLRGNKTRFKHEPLHYCTTIVSSMPWDASGEWLLEGAKYYEDDGKGYAELHAKLPHLLADYMEAETEAEQNRLWHYEIIPLLSRLIYYVSKDGVYYAQATVFDNLAQYSWKTLKQLWRKMDRISFMIEFLNMRYEAIGDQFYNTLNEAKHCYDPDDVDAMNALATTTASQLITSIKPGILTPEQGLWLPDKYRTSKQDRDVDTNKPLDMSGDWQASIIPLVIGQPFRQQNEYRVLKDFYVLSPEWVEEVISDFKDYYASHSNKTVRFIHDASAIGKAQTDKSIKDRIVAALKSTTGRKGKKVDKWSVQEVYIGKQPTHKARFTLINGILKEEDPRLMRLRFNRKNTLTLRNALRCTTVTRSTSEEGGFTKDKSKEKVKGFPQYRTTHFTDAFDTLMLATYNNVAGMSTGFVGPVSA